jgi:undecaprenyl-phosphate 4-deoxy-4-formamido-L-arabinose transferase
MDKHSISVVVPVFNSAESLCPLIERLEQALRDSASAFEILLVNDDSRDSSWEIVRGLARQHAHVRGINLMRNYGQHGALLCGIRAAQNEVIVTMDDDLQHPPEEIPKLLAEIDQGWDLVYGKPVVRQHGVWRDLASRLTRYALRGAVGGENAGNVSAFRAFRTPIRQAFQHHRGPFISIDVLLSWGTTRISAVAVRQDIRRHGLSNYTFGRLFSHAIDMMTGFSIWPLRLASLVGFAVSLFGVGVLCYVLVRYVTAGGSVPGFPFLAATIAIFSGAQLFALGIIGEYLARMHFRAMDRPTFVVRDDTASPGEGAR